MKTWCNKDLNYKSGVFIRESCFGSYPGLGASPVHGPPTYFAIPPSKSAVAAKAVEVFGAKAVSREQPATALMVGAAGGAVLSAEQVVAGLGGLSLAELAAVQAALHNATVAAAVR